MNTNTQQFNRNEFSDIINPVGVAHSVHAVLDLLVQATFARENPTLFEKLRKLVGWK